MEPGSSFVPKLTCHLSVYRKTLIDKLNGVRAGTEGAQDYDLILRATEQTDKIQHIPILISLEGGRRFYCFGGAERLRASKGS